MTLAAGGDQAEEGRRTVEMRVETHGPAETGRLAARLGRLVEPGDVITLEGDLGAGKTCFVQGLARGLGVPAAERVASPTFNIILEHAGRVSLYHVDLYRIADEGELVEIGLEAYLYGSGVCAVEWMDRFPELAPRERVAVRIEMIDDDPRGRGRRITAVGHGDRGRARVAAWLDAGPTGRGGRSDRSDRSGRR